MVFGLGRLRQLRYLGRYREISAVLARYGFDQVLESLQLYGLRERVFRLFRKSGADLPPSPEARLRAALEELGPAFVKLGQILSTRADLLPLSYVEELSRLQDRVPPFSPAEAKRSLVAEWGMEPSELFASFEEAPLAAASIGQVHRAVLHSGEDVVIKIKRPGVEKLIRKDLEILEIVADFIDRNSSWGELYQLGRVAGELKQIILGELDYNNEARNAERLRRNFADDPHVYLPRVYWGYTTRHVLTLEYCQGITLNRYLENPLEKPSPPEVAAILADAFFKQFIVDGFFHGDPHPGNLALLPDGRLCMMDFGAAGGINESTRGQFVALARAFQKADRGSMIEELTDFDFVPPGVDRRELIRDVEKLQDQYLEAALKEIDLGEAIQDLLQLSAKHRLRFPHEFSLLGRALLVLEGTVSRLDPQFNLAEAATKYTPQLQKSYLRFAARRLQGMGRSYRRLLQRFPEEAGELMRASASGELKIKIELPQADSIMERLKELGHRLGLSIILASLIMALSRNLKFNALPWLEKIPLGEAILAGAFFTGLWLIWLVLRSAKPKQ